MEYQVNEPESAVHHKLNFFTGLLLGVLGGSLIGATVMLLVAPQSGEKTRTKIQKKSKELRDQTVETVEDTMKQARTKAHQITTDVRDKAEELQQRGQDAFDKQKEQISAVVGSGKKAVHNSLN